MNQLSLSDRDAAILVAALDELALHVQPGPEFYDRYNAIDVLLCRVEAAMGVSRADLRRVAWERSPSPEVEAALIAIERELAAS